MSIEFYAIVGGLVGYILGLLLFMVVDSYRFKKLLRRLSGKPSPAANLNGLSFIRYFHKQLADKQNENNSHSGQVCRPSSRDNINDDGHAAS